MSLIPADHSSFARSDASFFSEPSNWCDPRNQARAKRANTARQASNRRRLIDPTTCDRDYSGAELEFMNAIQAYKLRSGRMFPTWSEVLEVLTSLGYQKLDQSAPTPLS